MIGGRRVTKKVREQAIEVHSLIELEEYLMERNEWDLDMLQAVDWSGMAPALRGKHHDMWVHSIKMQHEWLNVGAQKIKIDPTATDVCPCCGEAGERSIHLVLCKAPSMQASKILALKEFEAFMRPVKTAPIIMHSLKKALKAIMADKGTVCYKFPEMAVGWLLWRAAQEQSEIGWSKILKGRMSSY